MLSFDWLILIVLRFSLQKAERQKSLYVYVLLVETAIAYLI